MRRPWEPARPSRGGHTEHHAGLRFDEIALWRMILSVKQNSRPTPTRPRCPEVRQQWGSSVNRVLGALAVCATATGLLICVPPLSSARSVSPKQQVRQAWARFHVAYTHRAATSLCTMLAPAARKDLEVQVGRGGCEDAAAAWFRSAQYDRPAALHAHLISVQISGTSARTCDTDPNSPVDQWVKTYEGWKLASFFILG